MASPDGQGAEHHFHGGHAAVPVGRGTSRCETIPLITEASCIRTCFCWYGGKDRDNTVDGFRSVDRVEGGKHEMACFRRRKGRGYGLEVPHFAHEDHVRVLPEGAPERVAEGEGIAPDLALVLMLFLSRWRNSMGSSMVMMCAVRVVLI